MSTQVKKKHVPKGVRLGWTPLKEVKSVKLTPDLLKGEKVNTDHSANEDSSPSESSYLIP
ncbi:MAG TPA: hypothetical protein VNX40_09455 [Mucilaginibacter sp.]|nr:hypothetical protein [Mucilaginibacter sp.]